jgi:hypothetical protein
LSERNKQYRTAAEPAYITLDHETDFEEALSQAINEGLACISTTVAPVLRAHLDDAVTWEIGLVKSRSTIKDAGALEKGLEKMFGFGAKVFEKKILDALYVRLSLDPTNRQNLSFLEAVKKAKEIFELRTRKKLKSSRHKSFVKSYGARKG